MIEGKIALPVKSKMVKTKKRLSQQAELAFHPPVAQKPEGTEKKFFCPVYYPPTGEGLADLALRLAPVLAKTGWSVRLTEGENGEEFLELQNKSGQTRRLSPEEAVAWQALLPQLSGLDELFSDTRHPDGKE